MSRPQRHRFGSDSSLFGEDCLSSAKPTTCGQKLATQIGGLDTSRDSSALLPLLSGSSRSQAAGVGRPRDVNPGLLNGWLKRVAPSRMRHGHVAFSHGPMTGLWTTPTRQRQMGCRQRDFRRPTIAEDLVGRQPADDQHQRSMATQAGHRLTRRGGPSEWLGRCDTSSGCALGNTAAQQTLGGERFSGRLDVNDSAEGMVPGRGS